MKQLCTLLALRSSTLGIRVPLIVSLISHVTAGGVVDTPVTSMDATATVLELAGAGPAPATLDGGIIMPLLIGKTTATPERTLFWRVGKKSALRRGDWKLIRDGREWQLYDLSCDIGETSNLAARALARAQQLRSLWDKWKAEQIEPLWRQAPR